MYGYAETGEEGVLTAIVLLCVLHARVNCVQLVARRGASGGADYRFAKAAADARDTDVSGAQRGEDGHVCMHWRWKGICSEGCS